MQIVVRFMSVSMSVFVSVVAGVAACGPAANVPTDTAGDVDADEMDDAQADPRDAEPEADAARRGYGEPCTANAQCEGRFCITPDLDPSFVDGYCSAFMCDPEFEGACGPDAVCFDIEIYPPLCAKACSSDVDCRAPHYVCIGTCVPAAFVATVDRPGVLDGDEAAIRAAVEAVSADRMMRRVRILAGEADWDGPDGPVRIRSRAVGHPDHALAVAYVEAELAAMGLAPARLPFDARGLPHVNVEAEIPGSEPSLPPVLLTAHFDSTAVNTPSWNVATDPAPGAVDNGSGVAIALEIASILAAAGAASPHRTIRIVLFDGEEDGLLGSRDYAADLAAAAESPACTLNVDMVGWSTPATAGRFWYVFSEDSRPPAAIGIEAVDLFVPSARPIASTFTEAGHSDHAAFWAHDMCAVGMASFPRMPSNHTVDDTSSEFHPEFFLDVARSAVAVTAAWAGM